MIGQSAKVYFPSLNGLRFIAAFVVIIHHLEQIKLFFGLPSVFHEWHVIKIMGELGVTLFFTLSGFLITYLLLAEKEKYKTIDVKKFYIRRVLRIWPLYYLIIILGLFILPYINFFNIPVYTEGVSHRFGLKAVLYFLLLPNVVSNLYAYMPYLSQAWSIGIEEQFYLIWPWMVKFSTNHLKVLIGIVVGLVLITSVLYQFADHSEDIGFASNGTKAITFAYRFFAMLRISCMAIGGIGAYFLYNLHAKVLRFIFSPYVQLITYVLVLQLIGFGIEIPFVNHEFYSLFFIIIILNLAANPDSYVSLENKLMDYLGKISYSIYMWHGIAIIIALKVAMAYNPKVDNISSNIVYYFVTFVLTFVFSIASYEWFEMYFLKFKHLFAKIKSGNLDDTEGVKKDKNADYAGKAMTSY
jgi:peptidoglycan/LPS O-acetylase OafA/YrhL